MSKRTDLVVRRNEMMQGAPVLRADDLEQANPRNGAEQVVDAGFVGKLGAFEKITTSIFFRRA